MQNNLLQVFIHIVVTLSQFYTGLSSQPTETHILHTLEACFGDPWLHWEAMPCVLQTPCFGIHGGSQCCFFCFGGNQFSCDYFWYRHMFSTCRCFPTQLINGPNGVATFPTAPACPGSGILLARVLAQRGLGGAEVLAVSLKGHHSQYIIKPSLNHQFTVIKPSVNQSSIHIFTSLIIIN